LSIETLDDVVFETDDSAIEVLQTKHHISTQANLSDASPDLWKTLRVWIEGQADKSIPSDAQFFLTTTAPCSQGTAAAYLQPYDRDDSKALERLTATAATSSSEANSLAYQAFKTLSPSARSCLVASIVVLANSPSIVQLDEQLQQAVFYAVERPFLDSYLQRRGCPNRS